MATITGTVVANGLNYLANGIGQTANMTLEAWSTEAQLDSQSVTFDSASGGIIDIAGNVVFSLDAEETVSKVKLFDGAANLAEGTLTTDNYFPDGGSLIVSHFKITVTAG